MNLGEAIHQIEKSDEEKKRIISSVTSKQGRAFEVFNKYVEGIEDLEYWTRAHHALNIKGGFRPGRARQMVITKMIEALSKSDQKGERAFWNFYRHCVVTCMVKEHFNLNKLLSTNEIKEELHTTENIFKSILKFVDLYEVKDSDLVDLYEMYWFRRVENFTNLITERALDLDVVKKIVKKENGELVERLKVLEANVSTSVVRSTKLEEATSNLSTKVSDLGRELIKAKQELESIQGKITKICNSELQVRPEAKEYKEEKKDKNVALSEDVLKKLEHRLIIKIQTLEKAVKAQDEKLTFIQDSEVKTDSATEAEKNDLSNKNTNAPVEVNKDTLTRNLKKIFPKVEIAPLVACYLGDIIKFNKYIHFENRNLLNAFFEDVLKTPRTVTISAAPSFLTTTDLENEIKKNSVEVEKLDLIIIENYEIGFLDGYLLPYLTYCENGPTIVIVGERDIDSFVLTKINQRFVSVTDNMVLKICSSSDQVLQTATVPSNQLQSNVMSVSQDCSDLKQILYNSGVKLSPALFNLFVQNHNLVEQYFNENVSLQLSYKIVVEPFVCNKYGESRNEVVNELIKDF